jgi:ABC-2 type transport system permease protein
MIAALPARVSAVAEDLHKLPAFFRRDLLVLVSYRLAFFSDWVNLIFEVVLLFFVGRLIDPSVLPSFGGVHPTYVEFAAVGIAIGSILQANTARAMSAIRSEQVVGTLEMVFLSPTAPTTVLMGIVVYDLVYVPIRSVIFLAALSLLTDVRFSLSALIPVMVIFVAFAPFLWGLSFVGAAGMLTFRRGAGIAGLTAAVLVITSGSFFPVTVLPEWLQLVARLNPITIAVDGVRAALLGAAGWAEAFRSAISILPFAAVSLALGVLALRAALRRERRRGTLGLY